jgi:uncharacterized membrane protein
MRYLKKIFFKKVSSYFFGVIILSLAIGVKIYSQTLCWDNASCIQDFICDSDGYCLIATDMYPYRLVPPSCVHPGGWSNWNGDQ